MLASLSYTMVFVVVVRTNFSEVVSDKQTKSKLAVVWFVLNWVPSKVRILSFACPSLNTKLIDPLFSQMLWMIALLLVLTFVQELKSRRLLEIRAVNIPLSVAAYRLSPNWSTEFMLIAVPFGPNLYVSTISCRCKSTTVMP